MNYSSVHPTGNACHALAWAGFSLWLRALGAAAVVAVALVWPVTASPQSGPADHPVQPDAGQGGVVMPPLAPILAQFDKHRFFEDRDALTVALSDLQAGLNTATRPTSYEADILLGLAALHLSHRMLPEAQSFLNAVPDATQLQHRGDTQLSAQQLGLRAALDAAAKGFGTAPEPELDGWPDAPLFKALHLIARGAYDAAGPYLADALVILDDYPPALTDTTLLHLFTGAIESGAWSDARDLAMRMEGRDDSAQGAGYRYLLGRAASAGGDIVAAFDNYAVAAEGQDIWAQRARLALIDLGRSTGTLTATDARQLLQQTRTLWTGGELGLATLKRLAALELSEHDKMAALVVLADISRLHPDTPAAEAASVQVGALVDAIYTRGFTGEMPLTEFFEAHRAVMREFRFNPDFDIYAEQFAEHLAEYGASGLAAIEFASIRARMDRRADELARNPQSDTEDITTVLRARDRLRLKHAKALFDGGQLDEATRLLERQNNAPDSDLRDQYNLMQAKLFTATQRPEDVLRTQMAEPTADYLRLRAEAAFELGEWPRARETYEALLRRAGHEMQMHDRINLLLSAHRSGDQSRARDVIRSFPDLEEHLAALAEGLTTDLPDVLPLRDDAARQRLQSADIALQQLQAAGGRGGIP